MSPPTSRDREFITCETSLGQAGAVAILIQRDRVTAPRAAGLASGRLSAPELEGVSGQSSGKFVAGLNTRLLHKLPMRSEFVVDDPGQGANQAGMGAANDIDRNCPLLLQMNSGMCRW